MVACDIGPDLAFLVKEFSTVFLSKNPSDAKVRAYGFTISKVGLKLAGLLATSYGMRAIMKTGILQKAGVWLKGTHKNLSGRWIDVNESMSDASRAYQKQITGKEGQAFLQNGVKFDGMNNGTLIEAKGSYNNFINKNTGEFYDWFSGKDSLIDQARRQIVASNGAPINWYFSDQASMNAIKSLLQSQGIKGINFIYELLK
ncbi:MAG: hypothetical protein GXY86_13155 [Firmicutes bacterium]|nr:hypothetical protein [Bacillota bacterium]